jgi:aprataxin
MSWQNALVDYAKTANPSEKLPKDVYLTHTDRCLTVYDKFPKAMFHFLCLPRLPYTEPSSGSDISASTLNSVSALVSSKHGLKVLRDLKEASQEVRPIAYILYFC